MRARISILLLIPVMLFLTACSSSENLTSQALPTPTLTATPIPQATPNAGKSTLIGRLVSKQTNEPLADTFVRLADVVRQGEEGAFVLDIALQPGSYLQTRMVIL